MVVPVHLRFSAAVAIMDCQDRGQFTVSRFLKQAVPQATRLFQERPVSMDWLQRRPRRLARINELAKSFSTINFGCLVRLARRHIRAGLIGGVLHRKVRR